MNLKMLVLALISSDRPFHLLAIHERVCWWHLPCNPSRAQANCTGVPAPRCASGSHSEFEHYIFSSPQIAE